MKRTVGLLSTLVLLMTLSSCGSDRKSGENPFFSEWDTPYGVPPFDRIRPEHYLPAFERAMSLHEAEIDAITSNNDEPTFENVILAYDNSGQMLAQVSLVFGMLCDADTNEQMQALQEQVMPLLAAHADKIRLNEKLFEKVKRVYDNRAAEELDAEQTRLLQKTYDSFVRAGALLDGEQKARLKAINEELSLAAVKFGNNILAENNAYVLFLGADELDGLPSGVRDQAREKAQELGKKDSFAFTLHKPSLIPFLTYSSKRELREKLYKAYLNRGNNDNEYDNKQLINDFIRLRTEKAHLLGYPSYAAYVVADEMARTPEAVYGLLDEIWTPALERAKGELAEMEPLFRKDVPDGEFESWDWWYYAEKLRKQNYALDEEMLRPYFALENVQGGIFFLANRLYGITFRPVSVPLYHPEATAYEVLDADESHLGVLYFDFFPRAGKGQGAWCGNYVEQTYKDGERVAPVVSIVANFTRPTTGTPALLTLDEAETLFHEFGHALHFLFHDVKYRGLTEVEGDFVELPSQVMENWAFEPEMLKHYAVHYRTGEVIPQHLVDKLRRSALFNQGFATTELIAASLSDMDIHSITEYEPFDPMAFERNALSERRGLIPQIEPRYRYPYFAHIFNGGYSAGYYFYTWAEVLDKDAFEAFRESGDLFNRKVAGDFRRKLLARGGSEDGMSLYRAFRGKEPDKRAMLRSRGLWNGPDEDAAEEAQSGVETQPGAPDGPENAPADAKELTPIQAVREQ
ncbi:M3 family metallopeptidase [Alistipes sp.]|uniref:M3 family metallopeptidase n=1 Tax=Alistipes sp. TaxID=1872444 RepID=UPI003AF0F802